jgi:chemotaxis protein MotB
MAQSPPKPPPRPGDKPAKPVRTYKQAFIKSVLLALIAFTSAGGLGYYAWNLRAERSEARDSSTKASWAAEECAKRTAVLEEQNTELTRANADLMARREGDQSRHEDFERLMLEMQKNLNTSRAELEELRKHRAESEKRLAAFRDLTDKFKQMIDAGQLEVVVREGRMFVQLPSEVLFPSGSAELSKKGQLALMEVAVILRQFSDRRFMIAGHTDDRPVGGATYRNNWELSTARAVTVTEFLIEAGMDPTNLVAAGHGEHAPVASNRSAAGRQQNRRIEIVLLPNIEELPSLAEAGDGAKGGD